MFGNAKATSVFAPNAREVGQRHQQTFSLMVQEAVDLCHGTIEGHDSKLVVGNVHDQVLTHDGQTNKTEVATGSDPRGSADIDAGKTCAIVSPSSSTLFILAS